MGDWFPQCARRRFFSRIWRSLRGLRFGLEIAKVVLPTRRTFQASAGGALGSVAINPPRNLSGPRYQQDYTGYLMATKLQDPPCANARPGSPRASRATAVHPRSPEWEALGKDRPSSARRGGEPRPCLGSPRGDFPETYGPTSMLWATLPERRGRNLTVAGLLA